MCYHVNLRSRSDSHLSYGMMDCEMDAKGRTNCILSDESIAHLMASGQFKKIEVRDEKPEGGGRERKWDEAEFAAFIEKHLGAGALQVRHHAPEAVGKVYR